jgi:hypothetical protein
MRMSRFWRVIAPVVAASGLVVAGAIPAALASPTADTITINSQSALPHVSGHTLVVFQVKGLRIATISGTVTGAATTDVATLWSKPFHKNAFAKTSSTVTLTTGAYSFSVQPSQATAYEVQVTTGATVDVTSTPVTVYVATGGRFGGQHQSCTRTSCTFSYRSFEYVPAAAYQTEVHKKIYLYLAVGYPKLPGKFTLDTAARASAPKKINPTEFRVTFTWHITLRHGSAQWVTLACTKDTESRDGMGLPGRHGCGDRTISRSAHYVG